MFCISLFLAITLTHKWCVNCQAEPLTPQAPTNTHTCTCTHHNFPQTHIAKSLTDSDCATFENGGWVCWLETSSSDPTQRPLNQDTVTLNLELLAPQRSLFEPSACSEQRHRTSSTALTWSCSHREKPETSVKYKFLITMGFWSHTEWDIYFLFLADSSQFCQLMFPPDSWCMMPQLRNLF